VTQGRRLQGCGDSVGYIWDFCRVDEVTAIDGIHRRCSRATDVEPPSMRKPKQHHKPQNDLRRSLTPFDSNHTLIAVPITQA